VHSFPQRPDRKEECLREPGSKGTDRSNRDASSLKPVEAMMVIEVSMMIMTVIRFMN
jgi:hypothetical protein